MADEIKKDEQMTDVVEAKASNDVDAESADATAPAGGNAKGKNRKADLNKSVDPKVDEIEDTVKTPQGKHDVGIKEAVESLFDGEDLSEDFKTKTTAIFESAVHDRVETIRAELEEAAEAKLATSLEEATAELIEKVDSYLDYVVEQWMEQNEVAIEASIKVEVAESLINSLQSVVVEHNLNVTDEEVDAVAELESRLAESEAKYNASVESNMAIKEEKEALERDIAFAVVSEDLTDTQAEKLRSLSEGLSFDNVDDYTAKLEVVKENYFAEAATPAADTTEMLEEEVADEGEDKIVVDEAVQGYMSAISRMAAK